MGIAFRYGSFDEDTNAAMIVACDVFNDALGASPIAHSHVAMLRLEDVSVQTAAYRLAAIAELLDREKVPYGIGLIPDQLIRGQKLMTLSDDKELVSTLRWAQDHGARIILHGLHHSFNSAEDYEFWDAVHERSLSYDSPEWMRERIQTGIDIEEGLGLYPRFWETPHYSASSADYIAVGEFFNTSWERRRPIGWLPWVLIADQYGERVLPEDIGYVSVDGSATVEQQMARARLLLTCRGCVAAGFLHPATVRLQDVAAYVHGLRALGYTLIDPIGFIPTDDQEQ